MIRKLLKIKNLGRLVDAGSQIEWRRLTLIYGENGIGKSTLTAVLRSVTSHLIIDVNERKTLNSDSSPSIELLIDNNKHTLSATGWNKPCTNIHVFDESFVHDNVLSGYEVPTSCREKLLTFVVGDQAVTLQMEMASQLEGTKRLQSQIQNQNEIIGKLAGALSSEEFKKLPLVPNIDAEILKTKSQLNACQNKSKIKARGHLSNLALAEVDYDAVQECLEQDIDGLTVEVAHRVERHLTSLGGKESRDWIEKGIEYQKGELCPFCGQDTQQNHLVTAYGVYFGEAYKNLKKKIDSMVERTFNETGTNAIGKIRNQIERNSDNIAAWPELEDAGLQVRAAATSVELALKGLSGIINLLLKNKEASPLEKIEWSDKASIELAALQNLNGTVKAYNDAVSLHNTAATSLLTAAEGGNEKKITETIENLKLTKVRHSTDTTAKIEVLNNLLLEKSKIEKEKQKTRENLVGISKSILDSYGNGINSILEQFGIDFRLVPPNYDQTAGKAKANWSIKMRDVIIDPVKSDASPTIRTVLSTGDRRALGFAFFVAKVLADPNLKDKSVVLDDVMSSLDENRRICTRDVLAKIAHLAKQVIVLSHDAHFLKQTETTIRHYCQKEGDPIQSQDITTIHVKRIGINNSEIVEFGLDAYCRSEEEQNYLAIHDHVEGRKIIVPRELVPMLRPFLERQLQRGFFPEIHAEPSLGKQLEKLRRSQSTWYSSCEGQNWVALNDQIAQFHHDTNPSFERQLRELTETEATLLATKACELVRAIPVLQES